MKLAIAACMALFVVACAQGQTEETEMNGGSTDGRNDAAAPQPADPSHAQPGSTPPNQGQRPIRPDEQYESNETAKEQGAEPSGAD